MKLLYLECNMGIAGDMLMASLISLFDDRNKILDEINAIAIPNVKISLEEKNVCSVAANRAVVKIDGKEEGDSDSRHCHMKLSDVTKIIRSLNVSDKVKNDAENVYKIIANAESRVHGCEVGAVHFHEVGMFDAVADVVVCCYLIDKLKVEKIISSPINVGSGFVKCAHGNLPVPAPATAEILCGVPFYSSGINGELCTPTGAALVKYFVSSFNISTPVTAYKIGYGAGSKDFETANILRAFLCENNSNDDIAKLCCNIDDMAPEALAAGCERILDAGALDVYQTPVVMKKGRLGTMLTVLCSIGSEDKFAKLIFKHTSTIGIRKSVCSRYVLDRKIQTVQSEIGEADIKTSTGYGKTNIKPEYDSVQDLAKNNDTSFEETTEIIYKTINGKNF